MLFCVTRTTSKVAGGFAQSGRLLNPGLVSHMDMGLENTGSAAAGAGWIVHERKPCAVIGYLAGVDTVCASAGLVQSLISSTSSRTSHCPAGRFD